MNKSPIKSVGFWGAIGTFTALFDLVRNLPPELLQDTRIWWASVIAVITNGIALFGRWRAKLPLKPLKKF